MSSDLSDRTFLGTSGRPMAAPVKGNFKPAISTNGCFT